MQTLLILDSKGNVIQKVTLEPHIPVTLELAKDLNPLAVNYRVV